MATRVTGRVFSALAVLALAGPLGAATVAPPANLGELARLSRSVVLARAAESAPDESRSWLPYTATRFERLRQVAGEALPETFVVSEPGGVRGGRGVSVGGSPVYEKGRTYLLFLDRSADGRLGSRMMAYGLLVEDERTGLLVPLEAANDVDTVAGSVFEPVTAYDEAHAPRPSRRGGAGRARGAASGRGRSRWNRRWCRRRPAASS